MNYSVILLAFVICVGQILSFPVDNPKVNAFKELKALLNDKYEKEIAPGLGGNTSTEVKITLHILDYCFDAQKKELNTDMYFRQSWNDPRLVNTDDPEEVVGGRLLVERIWTPDTFFPTSSDVKVVKYPSPNVFVKVYPNGTILYSIRLQHTSHCVKKEQAFECRIEFESYGHNAAEIMYKLKNGPESINIGELPDDPDRQYNLVNQTAEDSVQTFPFGEYSRISIKLIFDNQKKEIAVEEIPKEDAKPNVNLMLNEGKKLGKLFSKFQLPTI